MQKIISIILVLAFTSGYAQNIQLNPNHPESYTVKKGDTLWDIASKFLANPWDWKKIWSGNPQIRNPHKIYPGDNISIAFIKGEPNLIFKPSFLKGEIKLSPQIRKVPIAEAIPTIPIKSLHSFLLKNKIINRYEEFQNAPNVISGEQNTFIASAGDKIYVNGNFMYVNNMPQEYGVFRLGKAYQIDNRFLGMNLIQVGVVRLTEDRNMNGELGSKLSTFQVISNDYEIQQGDRILPLDNKNYDPYFMPSAPEVKIFGNIIDIPSGVNNIGLYDSVIIDKGALNGLVAGNIVLIQKKGEIVYDKTSKKSFRVPDEKVGILMVTKSYDFVSVAILLHAKNEINLNDMFVSP